jgi:hypothetical protein
LLTFLSATARILELSMLCSSIMRHNKFVRRDSTFSFVALDSNPLAVQHLFQASNAGLIPEH